MGLFLSILYFLNASSGTYSARSGLLSDAEQGQNITSDLLLSITTVEDGSISFSKKTSCEDVGSSSGNYCGKSPANP